MGTWAAIPPEASQTEALATYTDVFTRMMWIGLAAAAVMFLLTPVLNRLVREKP